ncbi:hypothetical protein GCM10010305_63150 [Streptomyces termitum]|uniref:Uncharacterized protein n=1 Tax=Streptomyces termitum TaxID=67368 RepID=A0A918T8H8_9ACTN|nr:hypothetical protein GCM10010305_63150 [Streptomyces termitum]
MLQASSAASLFITSQTSRLMLFDRVTETPTHKAITNAAKKERMLVLDEKMCIANAIVWRSKVLDLLVRRRKKDN